MNLHGFHVGSYWPFKRQMMMVSVLVVLSITRRCRACVATNSIACNNATFGDPIRGMAKACYYSPDGPTPTSNTVNNQSVEG
jgi:hypothetical protein